MLMEVKLMFVVVTGGEEKEKTLRPNSCGYRHKNCKSEGKAFTWRLYSHGSSFSG